MFTTIAFLLYRLASFSVLFVEEAEPSDFEDFGTLLLAGGAMAVGVGVAFAVVRSKTHTSSEQGARFISIKPPEK
ncbi:MAG TPA: hypothetical protein VJV03_12730 [Pyrinomonadaceae bacterium]|nr:hypothetical protein [Pyrinomonadaceae bacterium]